MSRGSNDGGQRADGAATRVAVAGIVAVSSVAIASVSISIASVAIAVASVSIAVVPIVAAIVSRVTASISASRRSGRPVRSLGGKVAEAVGNSNISLAQAVGVEGVRDGRSRVGVLDVGANNSRIDGRDNAAELRSDGEAGIRANCGDGSGKGVEVLLGSDEGGSGSNDLGIVTERGDDLVGKLEL